MDKKLLFLLVILTFLFPMLVDAKVLGTIEVTVGDWVLPHFSASRGMSLNTEYTLVAHYPSYTSYGPFIVFHNGVPWTSVYAGANTEYGLSYDGISTVLGPGQLKGTANSGLMRYDDSTIIYLVFQSIDGTSCLAGYNPSGATYYNGNGESIGVYRGGTRLGCIKLGETATGSPKYYFNLGTVGDLR